MRRERLGVNSETAQASPITCPLVHVVQVLRTCPFFGQPASLPFPSASSNLNILASKGALDVKTLRRRYLSVEPRKCRDAAAGKWLGFGALLAALALNVILCGCAAVGASNSFGGSSAAPATTSANSPAISTVSPLPAGTVGTAYSVTLQASGGTAPYTWSVASGSLPAGLSLGASTGVISGVPNTGGAFSPVIQVTDTLNNSGIKALTHTPGIEVLQTPKGPRYSTGASGLGSNVSN